MLFLMNVLSIALVGALFEIWMEKDKGWGGALDKSRWYGKIVGEQNPLMKFFAASTGVPYFFGYAVLMYFVLVPTVLVFQYSLFPHGAFYWIAIYFAILTVEDFLWFVLNPYFASLKELLKGPYGNIWWHQRWVHLGRQHYLPRSYFVSSAIVLVFLALNTLIA